MDKRDLNNIGNEIKDIVHNAVDSMDYRQLNRDIQNTVNGAIDEVRRATGMHQNLQHNFDPTRNRQRDRGPRRNPNYNNPYQKKNEIVPDSKKNDLAIPVGKVSGMLLSITGVFFASLLGIAMIVLAIVGSATHSLGLFGAIITGLAPLFIVSLFLSSKGKKIRNRLKRFRQYLTLVGTHNYCTIKELSNQIGQSEKFVIKDLRRMITIGMFPQGRLDEHKTCFMLNNEVYQEYLMMQENIRRQNMETVEKQKAEERKQQAEQNRKDNDSSPEFRKSIDLGRAYIKQIKEANDAIPGEEISSKLYRLEVVTDKIFNYVELHPEQFSEIQKFMEYYLPTTSKLLNAYLEFDNQVVQGENITTAKKEIEDTLDTINLAFEKLLDSLFEDAAMDVSTDISVLETLLAQEGLTEKDFKAK